MALEREFYLLRVADPCGCHRQMTEVLKIVKCEALLLLSQACALPYFIIKYSIVETITP